MNWEIINGVTGIISAACAVLSLGYMLYPHERPKDGRNGIRIISLEKFMFFLLASSGWVLCCLSFLWFFEPFGTYPLSIHYKRFYGVLLAFPAIVIFLTGVDYLRGKGYSPSIEDDRT